METKKMQVRIFYTNDINAEYLEKCINNWLNDMGDKIEITQVLQSQWNYNIEYVNGAKTYTGALITIFYKTNE